MTNDCDRCKREFTTWMHNLQQIKQRWLCNDCVKELRHNRIKRAILAFEKTNPKRDETLETKDHIITYLFGVQDGFSANPFKSYRVESKLGLLALRIQHWLPNPFFEQSYGWTIKLEANKE